MSPFDAYFDSLPGLAGAGQFPALRARNLRLKLSQRQGDNLVQVKQLLGLSTTHAPFLFDDYTVWLDDLEQGGTRLLTAMAQRHGQHNTRSHFLAESEALLAVASAGLNQSEQLWLIAGQEASLTSLVCQAQAETARGSGAWLPALFAELQRAALDVDEPGSKVLIDLAEVEPAVAAMLLEWAEAVTADPVINGLEFIRLFMRRLVAVFPTSAPFWELLLLKLDRALGGLPATEPLIAAVPRFAFLRALLPFLNDPLLPAIVGDWLLAATVLQAKPAAGFSLRTVFALRVSAWELSSDLVQALERRVRDALRYDWERNQMDWFSEASASLVRLLDYAETTERLLAQQADTLDDLAAVLGEGITDAQGTHHLRDLLTWLIREAGHACAASKVPQEARDIFRWRVALYAGVDERFSYREIAARLQRLEPGEHAEALATRLSLLGETSHLFASLLGIVEEGKAFPVTEHPDVANQAVTGRVLQQLAYCRRLYNPFQARAELKAWFARTFAHSATGSDFQSVRNSLAESPLRTAFDEFILDLPKVTAAWKISSNLAVIAASASAGIARHSPGYADTIGAAGLALCRRDNELTLERAAWALASASPLETSETLSWWWNASVGAYLVHRERSAMQANLAGLHQALAAHLDPEELRWINGLLDKIYSDTLGVELLRADETPRDQAGKTLVVRAFTVRGPLWCRLFERPLAASELDLGELENPGEPGAALGKLWQNFAQAAQTCGDEEAAWHSQQEAMIQLLAEQELESLRQTWQAAISRSTQASLLQRGLALLEQTALGQDLCRQAEKMAEELAAWLMRLMPPPSAQRATHQAKCARDLTLFLTFVGKQLQTAPPSLAALNSATYLVMNIAPFVNYPPTLWRILWLKLQTSLETPAQAALYRWCAQLDGCCERLPDTRALGQQLLHAGDFVFSDNLHLEEEWRHLAGALLAVALTPENAPYPGFALAERLMLSAPLFADEQAASWYARQSAMGDIFAETLPADLLGRVADCQIHLSAGLLRVPLLTQLDSWQPRDLFYLALPSLPYAADAWRAALKPEGGLPLKDLLISRLLHWRLAPLAHLPVDEKAVACGLALLKNPQALAGQLIAHLKPAMPSIKLAACQRDIEYVLGYLGARLAGWLPQDDPAQWYWTRVGQFMTPDSRRQSVLFLEKLAAAMNTLLAPLDTSALRGLLDKLRQVTALEAWHHAPAFRFVTQEEPPLTLGFLPLDAVGPVWRSVFQVERPLAEFIQPTPSAVASLLEAAEDSSVIEAALQAWIGETSGDAEMAWQAALPHFDQALAAMPASRLIQAWEALLDEVPAHLPAWWLDTLTPGLALIGQVELGRVLHAQHETLAHELSDYLNTLWQNSAEDAQKCQRDLSLLFAQLGDLLRHRTPSLAALEAGRYLIECIAPFVRYSRQVWHLLWLKLQDALLRECGVRLAVYRWIAQFDGLSAHLPEIRELGRVLLHAPTPLFAPPGAENHETVWRQAFTGLLSAALTPDSAPCPGNLLAQRLVLSAQAFDAQTPTTWQHTGQRWQQQLLGGLLPDNLAAAMARSHTQIIASLLKLPRCAELPELRGLDVFAMLCQDSPWARRGWLHEVWLRSAAQQQLAPRLEDLLVSQSTGWAYPDPVCLAQAVARYRAAMGMQALPERIKLDAAGGFFLSAARAQTLVLEKTDQRALRLLLRRLAMYSAFGDELGMRGALNESLETLHPQSAPQQAALLAVLARTVADQYGEQHGLARCLQETLAQADTAMTASRLLAEYETLAQTLVDHFKLPPDNCGRDLAYLLRHLGLVLRGVYRQEDLGDWYWQRIGVFLRTETRRQLDTLFSKASKVLSKPVTPEQAQVLEKLFQHLNSAHQQLQMDESQKIREICLIP